MSPFLVFFNKLRLKVYDASSKKIKAPLILICPLQRNCSTFWENIIKTAASQYQFFGNLLWHITLIIFVLWGVFRSTFRCDIIDSHCAIKERGPKKDSVSLDCSVSMTQIHNCLIRVSNTQWTNMIIFQLYCSYVPLV